MKPNDIRLLNEMRKHSRASLTEFATNTDIPLSTVFKKVIRLENSGIISRHLALIDFGKAGYPFKVGVFFRSDNRDELEDYLQNNQSINTLIKLSGAYDYYAEMVFKDMPEYQEFEHAVKDSKIIRRHKIHFLTDVKQEGFEIPEAEEDEEEAICGMVKNENDILLCEDCPHYKDELCDYPEEDEEEFDDYFGDASEEFYCGYCGEVYPTEQEGEECCKAEKEIH